MASANARPLLGLLGGRQQRHDAAEAVLGEPAAHRVAPARPALGVERFAALLAQGGDLTLDQTLAHASSIVAAARAPRPG